MLLNRLIIFLQAQPDDDESQISLQGWLPFQGSVSTGYIWIGLLGFTALLKVTLHVWFAWKPVRPSFQLIGHMRIF